MKNATNLIGHRSSRQAAKTESTRDNGDLGTPDKTFGANLDENDNSSEDSIDTNVLLQSRLVAEESLRHDKKLTSTLLKSPEIRFDDSDGNIADNDSVNSFASSSLEKSAG